MVPEALSEIKVAGHRAAELCRQIMMYTGRSETRFANLDLTALVHESVGLLRVTLVSGCDVVCEFPPKGLLVWGDPAQIQQIVVNLVTNAAEAKASKVVIRAEPLRLVPGAVGLGQGLPAGDYVELSVSDNGEGMTPEVLARIFEPFFSTRFAGRGLGLPAVMGLVRAHQGAVAAESSPGAGCTLRIVLPVASSHVPAAPRPAPEPLPRGPSVVLIADDEEPVQKVISKFMARLGWRTLGAADGEEAMRKFGDNAGQVDLLLIDHLMPKLNGLEAARRIRRLNPKLPVIMMSGFTNGETLERFRAEGFEHFLKKPFELKELRELLQKVGEPQSPEGN
jgi:CheY-like chemotaxis protein